MEQNAIERNFSRFNDTELKAVQNVNEHLKGFVMAKNEPLIKDLNERDAKNGIYLKITKAVELSGQSKKYGSDTKVFENVTKFVYGFIIEKYPAMTLTEVEYAFNNGISHEYGEWFGWAVTTFTQFIKGYMTSQKRIDALKQWGQKQNEITDHVNSKPQTEIFRCNKELLDSLFKIWTPELSKFITQSIWINPEDETLYHLPSIYLFVRENWNMGFNDFDKGVIEKMAKTQYANYIKKSDLKNFDEKNYNLLIESVKMGQNKSYDFHIQSCALKFLFDRLKSNKQNIDDLPKL